MMSGADTALRFNVIVQQNWAKVEYKGPTEHLQEGQMYDSLSHYY